MEVVDGALWVPGPGQGLPEGSSPTTGSSD